MEAVHSAGERPHRLNDVQITLIKLFNRAMTDQETAEVRKLILDYYDDKLTAELASVVAEKEYTQEDYNTMLNRQNRTEFKQKIRKEGNAGSH